MFFFFFFFFFFFLIRNKKYNAYPCKPQFYYIKVGFKGVKIITVCFPDAYYVCRQTKQTWCNKYGKTQQRAQSRKTISQCIKYVLINIKWIIESQNSNFNEQRTNTRSGTVTEIESCITKTRLFKYIENFTTKKKKKKKSDKKFWYFFIFLLKT